MAKPLLEISKTEFNQNYNVIKVLTDKSEIMKQLKTFNTNNQAVAFGIKKTPKDSTPTWFKQYQEKMDATLKNIIFEMRNGFKQITSRIDNLVEKNNLKE